MVTVLSLLEESIEKLPSSFDAIVVGSGAGGGLSAYRLGQLGLKVLVLESGPFTPTSKIELDEAKAYPSLYHEAAARKTKDGGVNILQGRNVGGSTTVNWTSSFRTPKDTLKVWNEEFGLSELTHKELDPHFDEVEKLLGISSWDVAPNRNNEILKEGLEALGHKVGHISRNVQGCQNTGYCGLGCPVGAKQSSWRALLSESENVTILADAFVEKFIYQDKKVSEVVASPRGKRQQRYRFKGKFFICSGGAINSPALLMRSKLPDPAKILGKRTFLHPVVISGSLFDEQVDAFYGAPQTLYSDSLMESVMPEKRAGYKIEVPPIHPLLLASVIPFYGRTHRSLMESLPHIQAMIALQRDGFHEESQGGRVELSSNGLALLDYPLTRYMGEGFKRALLTMGEAQLAAGAREVLPIHRHSKRVKTLGELRKLVNDLSYLTHDITVVSAHVMGGCSMSADEQRGVVDQSGRYHHLDNLFVFDGSLFPTSVGTNPMVSIYALVNFLFDKHQDTFAKG